jgi:hypothetical protein
MLMFTLLIRIWIRIYQSEKRLAAHRDRHDCDGDPMADVPALPPELKPFAAMLETMAREKFNSPPHDVRQVSL